MASHMAHATSYMYIHSYFSDSRVSVFHHPPPRAKRPKRQAEALARERQRGSATRAIREPAAEERQKTHPPAGPASAEVCLT